MSRASTLYRLQAIDLHLDAGHQRLVEIEAALADNAAVHAAQRALLEIETQHHSARVDLRGLEHDGQSLYAKIAEVEQRLYSGQVSQAKVLQDLQADLASLKRRRAANEEAQLTSLLQVEDLEGRLVAAQSLLTQAENQAARSQNHLVEERARLQTDLAQLETERAAIAVTAGPDDLEIYDRLRRAKHGRAIAELDEDGVCTACGVEPTPNEIQRARRGADLARCDSCERILYAE